MCLFSFALVCVWGGGVHTHVHNVEAVGGVKVRKYELETVRVQMKWVVCCVRGAEHGTCRGERGRIGVWNVFVCCVYVCDCVCSVISFRVLVCVCW